MKIQRIPDPNICSAKSSTRSAELRSTILLGSFIDVAICTAPEMAFLNPAGFALKT